jgi:hypothetical protein
MAFGWDDALGAAIAYWMSKNGSGSGDTPNFYPVPMTPEEKRWDDAKYDLFKNSPTRNFINGLGTQYLGQMQAAPPNFQFMSKELQDKGGGFAAGFKAPTFDLSKLPNLTGGGAGTTPTTPPAGDGPAPPPPVTPPKPDQPGSPASPAGDQGTGGTDSWNQTQNPAGAPNTGQTVPQVTQPNLPPEMLRNTETWWQTYKANHPNWAKLGVKAAAVALAAVLGPYGALAGKALQWLVSRDAEATANQPKGTGSGFVDGSIAGRDSQSFLTNPFDRWGGSRDVMDPSGGTSSGSVTTSDPIYDLSQQEWWAAGNQGPTP